MIAATATTITTSTATPITTSTAISSSSSTSGFYSFFNKMSYEI